MEKDIVEIARQVVNNNCFKTNILDKENTLRYLINNGLAVKDKYGISLNEEFTKVYDKLLIQNHFTKYEIEMIRKGPYGLVYFRNELIQFFIHNPMYKFIWDGYRGHIINSDEKSSLKVYLENLCLSYDLKYKEPVLSIFLKDLILQHDKAFLDFIQYFEIADHSHLIFHQYNYKELIKGEWLSKEEDDIYLIVLNGMKIINDIFTQKYDEVLFLNIPDLSNLNYFRPIFFPTKLNFYLYVMEVYKLVNENICKKTLQKLTGEKNEGIYNLIHLYTVKYNLDNRIQCKFKETLKRISDMRNIPGHELFENTYDKDYWRQQDNINQQLYIFLNQIIKNETSDSSYDLKRYGDLFGFNGKISLWNGFNIPPFHYYDNQICAICERFGQRDSEILIAFKSNINMKKQFGNYCISKGIDLEKKAFKKFLDLLFNDLCKPSEEDLKSFFKGYIFNSNMLKSITDDSYISLGLKMYEAFIKKYPFKNCRVIADMSDLRYTFGEIFCLDTLRDSGLIYNTIYMNSDVGITTNPKEDCDIQVLVNTWD